RVPQVSDTLARQVAAATEAMRGMNLYKPPGVAETIDWASALGSLGVSALDEESVRSNLGAVLKYREDQESVERNGMADLIHQALTRSLLA
ncbi:MAG: MoxR family ATPase, partial [Actinomycetota bacterium]